MSPDFPLHRRNRFLQLARSAVALAAGAFALSARAAFRDDFDAPIARDPAGVHGWNFFSGDGTATMDFTAAGGIATMAVDATTDRRGIWWAIIKRDVTGDIDLAKLATPGHELRIEARIRSSSAPKRVNLSFNTQRTTDFHGNLTEFDLGEAGVWQTISFTTHGFDARPGDQVNAQLAMMDWGLGRYHVDIDWINVDVVDAATAPADEGTLVPYRPPLADPRSFHRVVEAAEFATVDRREPDANLKDWSVVENGDSTQIVTVNGTQYAIIRWDLGAFAGKKVKRSGLLELTTHSVQRPALRTKDFGLIRVTEILGGDPQWTRDHVTYASLLQGRPYDEVINTQMIIDVQISDAPGSKTYLTLSQPVMQRLIDGRTKGLILVPLGTINASFLQKTDYSSIEAAPKLYFDVAE